MLEAEIYARMLESWGELKEIRPVVAESLRKAMDAYAADYNNRTDGDLQKEAKELIKNDLIEW